MFFRFFYPNQRHQYLNNFGGGTDSYPRPLMNNYTPNHVNNYSGYLKNCYSNNSATAYALNSFPANLIGNVSANQFNLMNSFSVNTVNSFTVNSTTNYSFAANSCNNFPFHPMNYPPMNSWNAQSTNHQSENSLTANSVTVKSLKSLMCNSNETVNPLNSSSDAQLQARFSKMRNLRALIAEQEVFLYKIHTRSPLGPQNAQKAFRVRALIKELNDILERQTRQAEIEQIKLGYFDKSNPSVHNKSQKSIAYSGQDNSMVTKKF